MEVDDEKERRWKVLANRTRERRTRSRGNNDNFIVSWFGKKEVFLTSERMKEEESF